MSDSDKEFDKQFESRLTQTFLNLEPIDPLLYRSTHLFKPTFGRAVFGGQVVGQALVAASKTMSSDREAHSLHCYFLRPGSVDKPILYYVKQSRDGQTYSNRFVDATQDGRSIFTMMVSFKKAESDPFEHQFTMPVVPPPEDCLEINDILKQRLELEDVGEKERDYIEHRLTEEVTLLRKPTDANVYFNSSPLPAKQCVWIKTLGHLGNHQPMHKCAAAFMSDTMLIGTALLPAGRRTGGGRFFMTSVDHAMWFHHPVQADEWLLYEMESPQCGGGRGFCSGRMWDTSGRLVLSVAQEGAVRTMESKKTPVDQSKDEGLNPNSPSASVDSAQTEN
ncbi:acyl-coenzyme A thioesterase 8 isoform X2 [Aplysia californica]|uniref:Acyl-coenzyme A thioesterase 8 isoform X2 n=1 Tax=Aplysia californica TaxID=6500 RepID=A0ABM0JFX2_APLCA|nr:acyl-coenzyme A thioesterase 8 isoform X2 [Aplysia californica]